jgi:hypothetical protein
MWRVAFVIMALGMGGCMRDSYVATPASTITGNWKIERQEDRITGAPVPSAMVMTTNASNSFVDYARPASLQLTCFDGKPLVRFVFDFKIGTNPNSILGYRFDDRPGHDNVAARFLHEHRTVVIEDGAEVARFADELATANSLLIRVRSLNAGRTTAEFKLDGAPQAIAAAFAACPPPPLTAPASARPTKRGAKV